MKKHQKNKTPWPTKDAMQQVYEMNLWGNNNSPFYSGEGSHHSEIVTPYIANVIEFLTSFQNPLTVCDLGCGDFNIGKQLLKYTKQYIAIDIVPELITYNKEQFNEKHLSFSCLDIAKADLPKADCAILRQVLQHLSNNEVQDIVKKLNQYQYIILTEHLPSNDFKPNEDIISGQGIRLKKQSGINLLAAPFHFNVKSEKVLSNILLNHNKGIIKTVVYETVTLSQ